MKTEARTLSDASAPALPSVFGVGVGDAAKLHDLRVLSSPKLFPANRKNSPSSSASRPSLRPPPLPHFPHDPLGFLHRYIFSVNARRASHCFNRVASTLNRR